MLMFRFTLANKNFQLRHFSSFQPPLLNYLANSQLESRLAQEKKNQFPAPELVAYVLTRSFSHVSHQPGHNSSSLIAIDTYGHGWAAMLYLCGYLANNSDVSDVSCLV